MTNETTTQAEPVERPSKHDLPRQLLRAFDARCVLVIGPNGSGKRSLATMMQRSPHLVPYQPGPAWMQDGDRLEHMLPELEAWNADPAMERVETIFGELSLSLDASSRYVMVLCDFSDWDGIPSKSLRFWLERWRRWMWIRPKLFIRPDQHRGAMWELSRLGWNEPDGGATLTELTWDDASLRWALTNKLGNDSARLELADELFGTDGKLSARTRSRLSDGLGRVMPWVLTRFVELLAEPQDARSHGESALRDAVRAVAAEYAGRLMSQWPWLKSVSVEMSRIEPIEEDESGVVLNRHEVAALLQRVEEAELDGHSYVRSVGLERFMATEGLIVPLDDARVRVPQLMQHGLIIS